MKALGQRTRADITLIVLYLLASFLLQLWALVWGPLPWMNYGHGWGSNLAYGVGAPITAYLMWRRSRRARLAAYTFLSFDAMRSIRLDHWLPFVLSLLIILYLQTPAMRRIYPSMWSRRHTFRRWVRGRETRRTTKQKEA